MKVNKARLVEMLSREIMRNVSRQIREIVREEFDIERKRLRRQILEEIDAKTIISESAEPAQPKRKPFQNIVPQKNLTPKVKSYTGTPEIDSIINNLPIQLDEEVLQEQKKNDGFGQAIVTQDETDAINFNPLKQDPTQIDWSKMVEAVDQRAREKRQSGSIPLPM